MEYTCRTHKRNDFISGRGECRCECAKSIRQEASHRHITTSVPGRDRDVPGRLCVDAETAPPPDRAGERVQAEWRGGGLVPTMACWVIQLWRRRAFLALYGNAVGARVCSAHWHWIALVRRHHIYNSRQLHGRQILWGQAVDFRFMVKVFRSRKMSQFLHLTVRRLV